MDIPDRIFDELVRQGKEEEHREKTKIKLEQWTLGAVVFYAAVTAFQWYAIRQANSTALQAIVSEERPWLGLDQITPLQDYRLGGTPYATVKIKNYGKTPAVNIKATLWIVVATANSFSFAKSQNEPITRENRLGPVFPEHGAQATVIMAVPLASWAYSATYGPDSPELIIGGLLTYEDRLGGVHHTPICQHYVGGGFVGDRDCATDPTIPQID